MLGKDRMAAKSTIEPASRMLVAPPWDGACPGCGLVLTRRGGPLHVYLGASSACWELFQRLAGSSGPQPDPVRVRRLVQDTYAAQHPGTRARRAVQSVALHLMDLCVQLERDGEVRRLVPVLGRMPARKSLELHWLDPPAIRGTMTVVDALRAGDGEERAVLVEAWARQVWAAWEPHHDTVRGWLDAVPIADTTVRAS